jgi:hypothetical protein
MANASRFNPADPLPTDLIEPNARKTTQASAVRLAANKKFDTS